MKKLGRPAKIPGEKRGKMTFSFSQAFITKVRAYSAQKNLKISNWIEELLTTKMGE